MTRIRSIGLALVAILAIGAVAAAAASAAPEYFKEGAPLAKEVKFTGKAGKSELKSAAAVIQCNADKSKGSLLNSMEAGKIVITYEECESPLLKASCQTAKGKPGVIKTEDLKGKLVYGTEILGGTQIVAEEFTPESGTTFAEFTCEPIEVEVTGSVIGEVTPTNVESNTGEVILREQKAATKEKEAECGRQELQFVEGIEPCHHLSALGGPAWNITKETITFAKKAKIETKG